MKIQSESLYGITVKIYSQKLSKSSLLYPKLDPPQPANIDMTLYLPLITAAGTFAVCINIFIKFFSVYIFVDLGHEFFKLHFIKTCYLNIKLACDYLLEQVFLILAVPTLPVPY